MLDFFLQLAYNCYVRLRRIRLKEQLLERIQKTIDFDKKHFTLNAWERGFLESVLAFAGRRGSLSFSQNTHFEKIEAKCNAKHLSSLLTWRDSYDKEKREVATICAKYYKHTGYFAALATSILDDKDFIPSEKQYRKMCENKYAKKVIEIFKAEPLYPAGSMVELRKPAARQFVLQSLAGVPCLILEVLNEVKSAAKGAKQYNILPYGHSYPHILEERQIRKSKGVPKNKKKSKKTDTYDDIPF